MGTCGATKTQEAASPKQVETGGKPMNAEEQRALLKALELKIALEIKRVCEKNGLRCFLIYGTLLGAVRHGGFIPWDDDMDMGMLREDYDKFEKACQTDLAPEFLWQSWDNDPSYPFPAGKVRLKGTHVQEKFAVEGVEDGIYVDVFPFDAAPEGPWARRVQGWWYFFGKRLLWLKKGYGKCIRDESASQRMKYTLMSAVARLVPYGWLKRRFARAMVRHNGRSARQVAAPGDWAYAKQCTERAWFDDVIPFEFEGERFLSFRAADAYLRHLYGDYMELPPENERVGHEFQRLDFGPYARDLDGAKTT